MIQSRTLNRTVHFLLGSLLIGGLLALMLSKGFGLHGAQLWKPVAFVGSTAGLVAAVFEEDFYVAIWRLTTFWV